MKPTASQTSGLIELIAIRQTAKPATMPMSTETTVNSKVTVSPCSRGGRLCRRKAKSKE